MASAFGRDDKFIVIGTKGFARPSFQGQAILYQREGRRLPADRVLLDKPIGDKIFSRSSCLLVCLPFRGRRSGSRQSLRLSSTSALGELRVAPDSEPDRRRQLQSVIDHFVRLLDFTPRELQRCGADTDGHLVPRLRAVSSPVAIFIDGVDEYFNKHVEGLTSHPSVTGELSPNVWHFAQLGLVEVAYQLRRINHHIKVFAAVRKEAYARLTKTTVMAQHIAASAVDIAYSPRSLREIFINNVRLMKSDAMARPTGGTVPSRLSWTDRC